MNRDTWEPVGVHSTWLAQACVAVLQGLVGGLCWGWGPGWALGWSGGSVALGQAVATVWYGRGVRCGHLQGFVHGVQWGLVCKWVVFSLLYGGGFWRWPEMSEHAVWSVMGMCCVIGCGWVCAVREALRHSR